MMCKVCEIYHLYSTSMTMSVRGKFCLFVITTSKVQNTKKDEIHSFQPRKGMRSDYFATL